MLNCRAALPEECKKFADDAVLLIRNIGENAWADQEKKKRLLALSDCVVDKMNKKPKS
jgi:hypothetical protein